MGLVNSRGRLSDIEVWNIAKQVMVRIWVKVNDMLDSAVDSYYLFSGDLITCIGITLFTMISRYVNHDFISRWLHGRAEIV